MYNWELPDWPEFKYNLAAVEAELYDFAEETGEVSGLLKTLPEDVQQEALLQMMLAEAIKTSEIEGEYLSREDVMSSLKNNLGMNAVPEVILDKRASGITALTVAIRNGFKEDLSEQDLLHWHRLLFSSSMHIHVGSWRKGPEMMQVISGTIGKEQVHFVAPPSERVASEIKKFVSWFNNTGPLGKSELKSAVVRAAIAHLYFETIHPFEDGNGRIGRAIAEKALSQTMSRAVVLSLSKAIEANKSSYFAALKAAQQSNEITEWIVYFAKVTLAAQREAKGVVNFSLQKVLFFDRYKAQLTERQLKVIKKMLDAGIEGFKGGMTAKKYMSITSASKATATRDLQTLADAGVLISQGEGRSSRYILNLAYPTI